MADTRLELGCFIKGDFTPIFVKVPCNARIFGLKCLIWEQRKQSTLRGCNAKDMTLWKLAIPVPIPPPHLHQRISSLGNLSQCATELGVSAMVLDWFPDDTPERVIHIVVEPHRGAKITPLVSGAELSADVYWTHEISKNLWNRRDFVGQVFRKVNLTKTDFAEFQSKFQSDNQSSIDILASKAAFLHSRSSIDDEAVAYFASDATSDGRLVPQPFIGPPNGNLNVEVLDDDAMNIDASPNSTIAADMAYLSEGCSPVFPRTIRYLDLTFLKLKRRGRIPHLLFIRDDWGVMIDLFNKRKRGREGGAVFTGQPGIGKTCMLYYIFILCVIRAKPFLLQTMAGEVLYIHEGVQNGSEFTARDLPGPDVLALVDADGQICIPRSRLLWHNIRVLLISSPLTRQDRRWLTQDVKDEYAVFLAKPWLREDFIIAMLFLSPLNITFQRLKDAMGICGYNPRRCRSASTSPVALTEVSNSINLAIEGTTNLLDAMNNVSTGQPIHGAFEIWPSPNCRTWSSFVIQPISDWAFSEMIAELDRRDADAAYKFYQQIKGSRNSVSLGGQLFKSKAHKFFQSITKPRSFSIRSLDDPSMTLDIEFSSAVVHQIFGLEQNFGGYLTTFVKNQESCYLKPLSPTYSTFDAFLCQHMITQPGYQPFIGLQVTNAASHSIGIQSLEAIQKSLKKQIPELSSLRPSTAKKWIVLFVVPEPMAISFQKQLITDVAEVGHWYAKTAQYVLGLPEYEVLRS